MKEASAKPKLDLQAIAEILQTLSAAKGRDELIDTFLSFALRYSRSDRCMFIVPTDEAFALVAEVRAMEPRHVAADGHSPTDGLLPVALLQDVAVRRKRILFGDPASEITFRTDPYFQSRKPGSVLCYPLLKGDATVAILYADSETHLAALTDEQDLFLNILCSHTATLVHNAALTQKLQGTSFYLDEVQSLLHAGSYTYNVQTEEMYWSPEILRIYEIDPSTTPTMAMVFGRTHPEDIHLLHEFIQMMQKTDKDQSFQHRIIMEDGRIKTLRIVARSKANENGVQELIGTAIDITEVKHSEEVVDASLRETQKLVSLVENSHDCIGYAASPQIVSYVNSSWRKLAGLGLDEDISRYSMSDFLPAADYAYFLSDILPTLQREGHWEGEAFLHNIKTKVPVPVHQTIFFLTEASSGAPVGIATICRDITQRRKMDESLRASLDEKVALLKEVHHRVKNNLQLISSLLSLQASNAIEPATAELFSQSRNRVRSMALVHENLYRAGNFSQIPIGDHLRNLCAHVLRAYAKDGRHVDLVTKSGEITVDLEKAVSVGLIVNELVSNSLKHAFRGDGPARVEVEFSLAQDGEYELRLSDNGSGLPDDFDIGTVGSLGLQIVSDLVDQLHGTIRIVRDAGTTFVVKFPPGRGGRLQ